MEELYDQSGGNGEALRADDYILVYDMVVLESNSSCGDLRPHDLPGLHRLHQGEQDGEAQI